MNYKGINDYELMYRIRENDEEAVNIMIGKYEPIVINIARKYYPKVKMLGADMDDLVQEGRIAVVKAINSYDPNNVSLFYTYVSICVDRHFITYCRNLSTNKHAPLNYSFDDEYIYSIGDISSEPINYLIDVYNAKAVIGVKNSFDFIDSNIFELRFNGFSYREISELLDLSFGVVDSRLCKIRRTLQRIKDKF